jgi:hypothetical protein
MSLFVRTDVPDAKASVLAKPLPAPRMHVQASRVAKLHVQYPPNADTLLLVALPASRASRPVVVAINDYVGE